MLLPGLSFCGIHCTLWVRMSCSCLSWSLPSSSDYSDAVQFAAIESWMQGILGMCSCQYCFQPSASDAPCTVAMFPFAAAHDLPYSQPDSLIGNQSLNSVSTSIQCESCLIREPRVSSLFSSSPATPMAITVSHPSVAVEYSIWLFRIAVKWPIIDKTVLLGLQRAITSFPRRVHILPGLRVVLAYLQPSTIPIALSQDLRTPLQEDVPQPTFQMTKTRCLEKSTPASLTKAQNSSFTAMWALSLLLAEGPSSPRWMTCLLFLQLCDAKMNTKEKYEEHMQGGRHSRVCCLSLSLKFIPH